MITDHQYLKKYPIDPRATRLILGTIHPHDHSKFLLQFFYGNELSIWKILQQAFPQELTKPADLDAVIKFLKTRKITISDTIIRCQRIHPTALDQDLVVLEDNGKDLLHALGNSDIQEVICTSGFGKNNAFKLFYERILGQKITSEIRRKRAAEVTLPGGTKTITVKVLYSPARTANRGIANSQGYKIVKNQMTVDQYRISLYAQAFKAIY